MVTLRADPWSPGYGGDVEAALAAREGTEIQVDPTIETADWTRAIAPGAGPGGPLLFVDGVRRVEMRVLAEDGGRRAWGLAGSYAVGAVRSHGRATFERAIVGRVLIVGGAIPAPDLVVDAGTAGPVVYRAIAVPGDDPEAPLQVLQNEMREAEGRLAAELAPSGLVLADGPLHYPHGPEAAVVGIAKRMVITYLEGEPAALLPRLAPGERTPLFALGRQVLDRFAWYQRLIVLREPWHELSGIVRCEVRMAVGIGRALELADRVALELPRFAGRPGIDPRAPQNLTPVGALEMELRRRLGNPELLRRALQSELYRAAVVIEERPVAISAEAQPEALAPAPTVSEPVGLVLGTEDSTPLQFWVGVGEGSYLQLDDAVILETEVPGIGTVRISGIVQEVRARHEGLAFDSDAFLVERGVLPAQTAQAALVVATRFEPEVFVPPLPGRPAKRARGRDRDEALYLDRMTRRLPAGLSRDGEPVYLDVDFLDGSRGAHVNISGISGVATKTTYALFLLYALFHSEALGAYATNTKALVFNVKGEDLLWLDRPNVLLDQAARAQYERLGLPVGPFTSVGLWAPPRPRAAGSGGAGAAGGAAIPQVEGRTKGVTAYYWTIREFVRERYLRFLFAEGDDERSQIADLVARVESLLDRWCQDDPEAPATVRLDGARIESFEELCDAIALKLDDDDAGWRGRLSEGTVAAFQRRLEAARQRVGHLIWGTAAEDPARHRIDWEANQVTVIDIHNLHDRAKRFVTGVMIKRLFEHKERMGRREPLHVLVLDELNRYAPREGWSPIKEVLLDVAERGRSLGIILIGAEQTASEVERRVIANSAVRVVGRLDMAEAGRSEYGFLPAVTRARAGILKPGSVIVQQPSIPTPLQVRFPFPCWATRAEEAAPAGGDPFKAFEAD